MAIAIYCNHNVPRAVSEGLTLRGIDVLVASAFGVRLQVANRPISASWRWCRRRGCHLQRQVEHLAFELDWIENRDRQHEIFDRARNRRVDEEDDSCYVVAAFDSLLDRLDHGSPVSGEQHAAFGCCPSKNFCIRCSRYR